MSYFLQAGECVGVKFMLSLHTCQTHKRPRTRDQEQKNSTGCANQSTQHQCFRMQYYLKQFQILGFYAGILPHHCF